MNSRNFINESVSNGMRNSLFIGCPVSNGMRKSLFIGCPLAHEDACRRSIKPVASNKINAHPSASGSSTVIIQIPPSKQPRSTPRRGSRSIRNQRAQQHRHHDQRQSRSHSVRGATNLSKETRLLKSKLDRLFESFNQTVVATSQSQGTQLESLGAENQNLRVLLSDLETETLQQFSELEDCDELIAATEERRSSWHKEAFEWKLKCEKLTKEVVFLKEIEKSNESLKKELSSKADTIRDLEQELFNEKLKQLGDNKENKIGGCSATAAASNRHSTSLIVTKDIFGNEIPVSFLDTEHSRSTHYANPQLVGHNTSKGKTNRRKSFHGMTLRGRQANKKYQF